MAKVKVEKKKKAARGTEVGGFEAHTKGAPLVPGQALPLQLIATADIPACFSQSPIGRLACCVRP